MGNEDSSIGNAPRNESPRRPSTHLRLVLNVGGQHGSCNLDLQHLVQN